jgi:tRNA-2-methylthio-N6-dimethylallyladenosine synthase
VEVLVEGESRDARRGAESGQLTGRTREHKIVNFLGERRLAGRLVPVRIIGAFHNSLRGEIVEPAPRQHGRPDAAACADGGPP